MTVAQTIKIALNKLAKDLDRFSFKVEDVPVAKLIAHPKYNTPRYANDVGLIRLSKAPDASQGEL